MGGIGSGQLLVVGERENYLFHIVVACDASGAQGCFFCTTCRLLAQTVNYKLLFMI